MQHLLSVDDMKESYIFDLWSKAIDQKSNYSNALKNKILTNLFYEPSTRTSSSFYSAMVRQGGSVIPINNVKFSSAIKGESLEDTVMTMATMSDCIVLRHPLTGSVAKAANVSQVPIINAGDGEGEHPTQTLLDGFTIFYNNNEKIDNLRITMIGDLKNGRTVKSLVKFLSRYSGNHFNFVSPKELSFPKESLPKNSFETTNIDEVINETDVLYVTRVQTERGSDHQYSLSLEKLNLLPKKSIVMHPLPRVSEIPREFDSDPRAKYFDQMRYGLWCRMVLLKDIIV